jgi:hypothetical protein
MAYHGLVDRLHRAVESSGDTMGAKSRIGMIQRSTTSEQLLDATVGYAEEAIATHPALRENQGFLGALASGKFLMALGHIRRARLGDEDEYQDVIRVLEFAATRALAIMMLSRSLA